MTDSDIVITIAVSKHGLCPESQTTTILGCLH